MTIRLLMKWGTQSIVCRTAFHPSRTYNDLHEVRGRHKSCDPMHVRVHVNACVMGTGVDQVTSPIQRTRVSFCTSSSIQIAKEWFTGHFPQPSLGGTYSPEDVTPPPVGGGPLLVRESIGRRPLAPTVRQYLSSILFSALGRHTMSLQVLQSGFD